jgi:A/G-specific adenine glycosylase
LIPALLSWYRVNRRDLPFRRDPTPWRVLVSETMLQQTRVSVVSPRFEPFVARFPDPAALAAAPEEAVLAEWSGLGYYRRARSLRAAAAAMVRDHRGEVPDDRAALLALPGVGAYTAGAVLSIAFGRAEPILDGNVERVLSRLFLVRGDPKRGATRRRLEGLAREAVSAGPPAEVNQALMEIGALVCLPGTPRCGDCPLSGACAARKAGVERELPELPPRRAPVDVRLSVALARRGERVLLFRAPEGALLAGTWAPPFAEVADGATPVEALADLGLPLRIGAPLGTVRHAITHRRIEAVCHRATLLPGPLPPAAILAPPASVPLSSLARKLLGTLATW